MDTSSRRCFCTPFFTRGNPCCKRLFGRRPPPGSSLCSRSPSCKWGLGYDCRCSRSSPILSCSNPCLCRGRTCSRLERLGSLSYGKVLDRIREQRRRLERGLQRQKGSLSGGRFLFSCSLVVDFEGLDSPSQRVEHLSCVKPLNNCQIFRASLLLPNENANVRNMQKPWPDRASGITWGQIERNNTCLLAGEEHTNAMW